MIPNRSAISDEKNTCHEKIKKRIWWNGSMNFKRFQLMMENIQAVIKLVFLGSINNRDTNIVKIVETSRFFS